MQPIALAFWAMTADVDVIARVLRVAGMHASQNAIARGCFARTRSSVSDVRAAQVACAREQRNGMSAAGFANRLPCTTRDERRSAGWLRWDGRHAFVERGC
ncbi:MAG TPA: hypothetical protein VNT54_02680 [Solirubrobacteraceae bacterium]|nr:hypothetical protein [Solirubrobacteraceae bacterium]